MRLYRSIVTGSLLAAAVAFANTVIADRIHDYAESLNYTGISNILQEDPSLANLKDARGRTPLLCALSTIYSVNADGLKKTIDLLLVSHADTRKKRTSELKETSE